MKKIFYFTVCLAAVTAVSSCKSKRVSAQTPSLAAKEYTQSMHNGDYDAFVDAIVFEPVTSAANPEHRRASSSALRTIHHPRVEERGGLKEINVVPEHISPDGRTANVVLANKYHNGITETVDYNMINDDKKWKIRVNDHKEVWKAVSDDGEREVLKIKDGKDRDFVKTKDDGDKEFVKEITKRNGQVEVIKTLHNGERHRMVLKDLEYENRDVDKFKDEEGKLVDKDIDRETKEILKDKEHERGERTVRHKEVIEK